MASSRNRDSKTQPDFEQMLDLAYQAIQAGNKDGARVMLEQVLRQDKRSERALMGMALTARSGAERVQWLRRVLKVNPDNETARTTLEGVAKRHTAQENRTLVIFGVVLGVLVIVALIIVVAVVVVN